MMKTVVKTVEPADRLAKFDHIRPLYLDALTLVERLHRRLLDVIKDEFDRRGRSDINSVQALLLYNIGDKELTAGELRTRGYYLGSNVSYNLKKLVEMGFLDHQRSRVDRRSVRIKLTEKGREVREIVDTLYQKHVRTVEQVGGINADEFATLNKSAGAVLDRSDPLPAVTIAWRSSACIICAQALDSPGAWCILEVKSACVTNSPLPGFTGLLSGVRNRDLSDANDRF
jgi:DNA-binding MarR family transcriptional regulator